MPLKHYKHIEVPVKDFFKVKGFEVELEPQGSRGPDLVSKCGKIVGEIKASEELAYVCQGFLKKRRYYDKYGRFENTVNGMDI